MQTFTVRKKQFKKEVKIYYGLMDFLVDHRRMLMSRDDMQLRGTTVSVVNTDLCFPYDKAYDAIASTFYSAHNCIHFMLIASINISSILSAYNSF